MSKISARQDSTNMICSTGPDVCNTPMGSLIVPVAYISSAKLDPSSRLVSSVRDNDSKDFVLNSRATQTTGHEKGTYKGIVVQGYMKVSHCREASSSVYSEGWACARDGDPAWVNRPDEGAQEKQREMQTSREPVQLAGLTSNFKHACNALGLDANAASDALHDAKHAAGLGGADNCVFDTITGDIFHNGEHIGNLGD